ncbi:MAG: hypothetical protein KGP12_06740 [Actinomycetales bacterium]|nr:hypothetical protein [Actinomycetales bacterium]
MPGTVVIHGEPSIGISGDSVEAWITVRGSHIAPVTFRADGRSWQPYSLAPWRPGEHPGNEDLLEVLRGDFWCFPFGAQPDGPAHGLTSCAPWQVEGLTSTTARLAMDASDTGAHVVKTVSVRDGDTALYQQWEISGASGRFPYGTHPILDFSAQPAGSVRLSSSPIRWASVLPEVYADPAIGEQQALLPGGQFTSLGSVPMLDGGRMDLSRYPTPPGHEDIVMLVSDPEAGPIAWSAASVAGRVWLSLRSVADFPSTVLWISNGGRPQPPWSSRHLGRIGIEDVCSYFHAGLVPSREDRLAPLGIPTTRGFSPDTTTTLRIVQAVAFAPEGFGRVASIEMAEPGSVTLVDDAGARARCAVDWQYVLP